MRILSGKCHRQVCWKRCCWGSALAQVCQCTQQQVTCTGACMAPGCGPYKGPTHWTTADDIITATGCSCWCAPEGCLQHHAAIRAAPSRRAHLAACIAAITLRTACMKTQRAYITDAPGPCACMVRRACRGLGGGGAWGRQQAGLLCWWESWRQAQAHCCSCS